MKRAARLIVEEREIQIDGLDPVHVQERITATNRADVCLGALYDHHQCSDDFKEGDEIDVEGVGVFRAVSFHIVPANEEMMASAKPFIVKYDGVDGKDSAEFDTIEKAAEYVKGRWEGWDYCSSATNFHNDYGQFYLVGFSLDDVAKHQNIGKRGE